MTRECEELCAVQKELKRKLREAKNNYREIVAKWDRTARSRCGMG